MERGEEILKQICFSSKKAYSGSTRQPVFFPHHRSSCAVLPLRRSPPAGRHARGSSPPQPCYLLGHRDLQEGEISALQGMIRKGSARLSPRALKQIHGNLVVNGIASRGLQPLRELLLSCIASFHGSMDYARRLFDEIPHPDLFMHNAMLRGYAHAAAPDAAFAVYGRMEAARLRPDGFTFCYILRACTGLQCSRAGRQVHGVVVKLGFLEDAFVRNALINMHAKCGDLGIAGALLDEAGERDIVAWSAVIAGHAARGNLGVARQMFDVCRHKDMVCWNVMLGAYAKHGEMEKVRELFDRAPEKDVVSWNTIITGYASQGMLEQALDVFDEMRGAGWMPDEATIVSLLSCCANAGSLDVGKMIHALHLEDRPSISILTGNALVSMYAKCGDVNTAMEVFNGMKERDVWTWNSIIGGLALHGQAEQSVEFFNKMLEERIHPNEISFLCVLGACSHAGLVEDGQRYFSLMKGRYRIEPNARHYSCIVDMLGRAGLLDEAFAVVSSMRCEPSAVVWRTLLGACRTHGNVALGKLAQERLLNMSGDASGDYVMLSGIYASYSEWLGVETVRISMDKRGLKKVAGCAQVDRKTAGLSAP
ncbi:pentatricopeptide repeat-containing protein At5g15300-like [Phragmites australis]|uniref:pentatricopeptide repeat-containing protein At5g15300-like n=1 Tax=Phragmites australis TaxID=29695 RepID=UPI002D79A44B|nr:pentatricopeptide repeat-containing protein At5g15300-like [Phragmites australis]